MNTILNTFLTILANVIYCLIIVRLKKKNYSEIDQFFALTLLFMFVIPCITGGVACGKTQVSNKLSDIGYKIVDMDVISREIVTVGKPAYREIVKYFGDHILNENLEIDRKKLRKIVFSDSNKRKKLNKITHIHIIIQTIIQVIYYRIYLFIVKFKNVKTIIVSPLLFENGLLTKLTSPIYVVATTRQLQTKNLIERDKCTEDLANSIIDSQMDLKMKCKLADKVIWNTGTLEELYTNVNKTFITCSMISVIYLNLKNLLSLNVNK
ncbi:dephospho- kinase family [Cryptosporidium xiaoi]|uniref:Dephospho- kinase family n=1 Tax=Cryptosporidium xiaoi TaxID=659607 RepID=A0AAV9Y1F3_9CRYT